ncbi:phosphatidylinositol-4- kinase [Xylographa trunciseda]|nr:phosphatidylinositol-4- kinase [Xylographa trunciseda]
MESGNLRWDFGSGNPAPALPKWPSAADFRKVFLRFNQVLQQNPNVQIALQRNGRASNDGTPTQDLRGRALGKIAALSVSSPHKQSEQSDFSKLYRARSRDQDGLSKSSASLRNGLSNGYASLSSAPMSLEELHVLLALCRAGPDINELDAARALLAQLLPYLSEVHEQAIAPSPFLRLVEPSPWEALTYGLVVAVLAIGIKHTSLHGIVYDGVIEYIENCQSSASRLHYSESYSDLKPQQTFEIGALSISLIGLLEASASHLHFFTVPERLKFVTSLRQILTERFLVCVEGAFSSIRTSESNVRACREWKQYTKSYASSGRPLGAMLLQQGFMKMLVSCSSLQLSTVETFQNMDLLDFLMSGQPTYSASYQEENVEQVQLLSQIAADEMRLLEDGADYLQLGSAWQQRLASAVKGYALIVFLGCIIVDEEVADLDVFMSWLEESMADPVQMADDDLACVVLRSMSIVAKISPTVASSLSRSLPRFIVQGGIKGETIAVAAECLAFILQLLSQDAVITGLYSLGNVLSVGSGAEKGIGSGVPSDGTLNVPRNSVRYTQHSSGSAISLDVSGDEEMSAAYGNVIRAIVSIATTCKDSKVTPLALSMLLQKLGRISMAVDLQIIVEAASLAPHGEEVELKSLLKLYDRFAHDAVLRNNDTLLDSVTKARVQLANALPPESPLHQVYFLHLLETIVSKGDVHESENTHKADVELAAREIGQLLRPLAILTAAQTTTNTSNGPVDENAERLQRESWFNIVVHGIIPGSVFGQRHAVELQTLATHSRSLVTEDRADHLESDIELNTVLRRGMNGDNATSMKRALINFLPTHESHIRTLSYPRVIFLHAAYLVETLRAYGGYCAPVLSYFVDSSVNQYDTSSCMVAIVDKVMAIFLKQTLGSLQTDTSAPYVSKQLAIILTNCCHRIPKCQQVAASCADRLIGQMPSSLCQRTSLFALLELLSLMWLSCLESEIDEYEWKSTYTSALGNVSIQLSDDFGFRRRTLDAFYRRARVWVMKVINIAPLDVKGLLQTYLSEYDDDGAYGHVALGRSFALEMGSIMSMADHRLGAIERTGEYNVNTGSDFIAQYTTRQEYKYADALPEYDQEWVKLLAQDNQQKDLANSPDHDINDARAILVVLERQVSERRFSSLSEIRDILRRAAALLCRSKQDQCAIVRHLVRIPFTLFTKRSIKLGISLWLGVINENPRMEPRILVEIAEHWEHTVQQKMGIFDDKFHYLDPFYIKEEFAPSDKTVLLKRAQAVHNLIAPHLRILLFLGSHFNANRLGSPHLRRIFQRLIRVTLFGLQTSTGHPLAREFHFQVVLFGLTILRYSDDLGEAAKWRFKDRIISTALAWFSHPPRWSFGGNRIQIKAEVQLMTDVEAALNAVVLIGSVATKTLHSLSIKQELLVRLLENEHTHLQVWLFPTDYEKRRIFHLSRSDKSSAGSITSQMLRIAWTESPTLAVQLQTRFQLPSLTREVRWLLLNAPEAAMGEPDALQIMLENGLPTDVSYQLKYLLYWAPVNPITAVTYFLPAYGNHPFILQYAMRALESHSVDITFFYVPQIVQSLRYDALGYVQRYIIETGTFSQLFAHQIIWNIKANAYKDEDSTVEDPLKPTLDMVMNRLIASFSRTDKLFYEREFSFFNEITDISGKLRPFIKKSKPEKKQKIEEELRKIKVEVGVYLPSNPDGVVIGIDRKSGKPLQSHAKAPYMATFRIKKNKGDMESADDMLEKTNQNEHEGREGSITHESTYEVWQSAIFKVGDDCRQDVLALQMIAAFRGIFNNVGLDVYVYPYRVTATAPGCGVIDVLPNSISRDMLGREAVNGLYDYFVSKYGGEQSIRFQEARNNFVKSMAAYSVISYLLQFKDRHNGNIMVDDAGHILHIDFGFCFDIAPGGIKFERAPFKLTSEMVAVMGGSTTSQSYQWFEELCIKAFLASRQYTEKLCHMVVLMLDSGLPCFKPETITHFRERFVLERSEREAADFMKDLIKKSYGSYSTGVYDQFQLLTNGIPY